MNSQDESQIETAPQAEEVAPAPSEPTIEPRELKIKGLHHITCICSNLDRTVSFYRDLLGMTLLKQTTNDDDPNARHFYFGDPEASPGSMVTFLEYANMDQGQVGVGIVHHFALRAVGGAVVLMALVVLLPLAVVIVVLWYWIQLLTFIAVVPNPFSANHWPVATQYHFGNFIYFFVILSVATLAYSWRTVITVGTWTSALWIIGIAWVWWQPDRDPALMVWLYDFAFLSFEGTMGVFLIGSLVWMVAASVMRPGQASEFPPPFLPPLREWTTGLPKIVLTSSISSQARR